MTEHELKCHEAPFTAMWLGHILFEYRVNDRGFKAGDRLILLRWKDGVATGARIIADVTYVLHGPEFGVPPGYCVMSLNPATMTLVA